MPIPFHTPNRCTIGPATLAALLASACATGQPADNPPTPTTHAMATHSVTLAIGHPVTVPGEPITLEMLGVKDSRCPEGAKCIWAGHAEVTLRVTEAGAPAETLAIGTQAPAHMNLAYEATHGAHRFTLLELVPAPVLGKTATDGDYRASVQVSTH